MASNTNEKSRDRELFEEAVQWIWEHTIGFGEDEYIKALKSIGMTDSEIKEL